MGILGSFKFLPKTSLGIDIGTSAIKVVELSRWGARKSMKNYGAMRAEVLYEKPFRTADKNSLLLSSKDIARALRGILEEAKIDTRRAVFSIPDFSSFFTHFELPSMSPAELPQAVQYEARKHVPLPFSEVTFDWQVVNEKSFANTKEPVKILLVAVPNELINQYQEIARLANLQLTTLEAEVFGLIRSCQLDHKERIAVLDMGAQTTTINVVEKGKLQSSRSIDIGGGNLTERIAQSLSIDRKKAEERKRKEGLSDKTMQEVLSPLLNTVVVAVQQAAQSPLQRVILGGGSAQLPGFAAYMRKELSVETELIDPFRSIFFPPPLEGTIQEMGPSYAVAVGMALRGLE